MNVPLQSLIEIGNPSEYKIHLASWNRQDHPLDIFVQDRERWFDWNRWKEKKDDFSRRYIFSLIDYYHEQNKWLFGGVFEMRARNATRYELQLVPDSEAFIGRLKLSYFRKRGLRGRSFYLEKHLDQIKVCELLRDVYSGEHFCGYENINHSFVILETIVRQQRPDWHAALRNVKGVYLITDRSNGKRYVGSAYGNHGIWSRWCSYIGTGHGWNDELTKLIKKRGLDYARKHYAFALLEYRPMRTDDKQIIERETYWKDVMLSRGQYGYNKN